MTPYGCCDTVVINRGTEYIQLGKHYFKVRVTYCGNCGSVKATTNVKESKMAGEQIIIEKAGQTLKAEYFKTEDGCGCRFYINEEFIQEEIYQGKSISWAESAAQNWLSGVKTLNG